MTEPTFKPGDVIIHKQNKGIYLVLSNKRCDKWLENKKTCGANKKCHICDGYLTRTKKIRGYNRDGCNYYGNKLMYRKLSEEEKMIELL